MLISEALPILQKYLLEHGDMLLGWENEGRLYSFNERDLTIIQFDDEEHAAERIRSAHKAPGLRMLLMMED